MPLFCGPQKVSGEGHIGLLSPTTAAKVQLSSPRNTSMRSALPGRGEGGWGGSAESLGRGSKMRFVHSINANMPFSERGSLRGTLTLQKDRPRVRNTFLPRLACLFVHRVNKLGLIINLHYRALPHVRTAIFTPCIPQTTAKMRVLRIS